MPQQSSARSNIRRLALGRMISITGSAAAYTALNFTVWEQTRDPLVQALSLFLTFGVAGLLGPLLGTLGDRYDRRLVMVWSEALSIGFFSAMVFAHEPVWLIALAFGSAIADQPFFSASRAAIPSLAESDDEITWANSLVSTGVHSGIAIGPVIGGVLLTTLGSSWVFGINAVSFGVSLLLTLSIDGRFQEERSEEASDEHRGFLAGVSFLFREPVLRRMSIAWLVFVLGMGMGMVADAPVAEHFDAGGWGFGVLIACWGTGSVLGTLGGRFMNARTEPVWLVWGAAGIAAAAFGTGLLPWFPLVLASLFAMGICDGLTIVAENGIMQRRTPDAIRSRTAAAFEGILSLGLLAAYVAAVPTLTAFEHDPQMVYTVAAFFGVGAFLILVPLLKLRRVGDDVEPEPIPSPAELVEGERSAL